MDAPFPFGFPAATVWYLILYVATLVIHVIFMSYVLAGSAYLAIRQRSNPDDADAAMLRDWLPFMLSAAITAAVAPLLFIQILYQRQFYTANLLLFHRWMLILPVLIAGFYLLYLARSSHPWLARPLVRRVVGAAAALCFLFIAWSWTENHLLSVQSEEVWSRQYGSGEVFFRSSQVISRLSMWFAGTFPIMAVTLGWQLHWQRQPLPACLPIVALSGLGLSTVFAIGYGLSMDAESQAAVTGPAAWIYSLVAVTGLATQAGGWWSLRRTCTQRRLALTSVAAAVTIVAVAVVRECLRLSAINVAGVLPRHAAAADVAGLPVFVAFLAINGIAAAFCVRIVLRKA